MERVGPISLKNYNYGYPQGAGALNAVTTTIVAQSSMTVVVGLSKQHTFVLYACNSACSEAYDTGTVVTVNESPASPGIQDPRQVPRGLPRREPCA